MLSIPKRGFSRSWSPALTGTLALLGMVPRVSVMLTVLLGTATLVVAILPVASVVVTGLLVGAIPSVVAQGLASPAGQAAFRLFLVASALIVVGRVLGPFQTALATTLGRQVDLYLQERLMAVVSHPPTIGHLEDTSTLDLIRNAQGVGVEGLHPGDAVRALATLVPSWLQAIGSAFILIAFQPLLGLLWLILWPLVLFVLQREFVRVGQAASGHAAAVRRSDYLRDLALTPRAAKELRVWGMLDWLIERYDTSWFAAMEPVWRTRRPGRPILWLATGLVAAANLGSLALLAGAAIHGDLGLGALAVYIRAVVDASSFRAFDDPNSHLAYAAVSVPSLLELERRLVASSSAPAVSPPLHLAADQPRESIVLENVAFHYPGQTTDVLAGLDLVIPAGRSLAIVGANGAGKTTLIKLLCRFYAPTAGHICVDGVDLNAIDPASWQRRIAAIFQDFVSYHLSAHANVGLGAPEHADDLPGLRAAAARAGALDLIESLPQGWDTVLSRQFSGGVDLSGGQWQRIALARALFAAAGGARILILDEPTANLDVRAEADLYDRFLEITAGLTTVIISHRFSTVRRADQICILEGGRVVEAGTHDTLVALGGRYARMFALQAARFATDSEESEEG